VKFILRFFVCAILTASLSFGQAPPLAVPFIDQVSPASLVPGSTTLTFTGANFNQNAIVTLVGPGVGSVQSASTTVNSSGTQIVASFSPSPVTSTEGTLGVTVTNPSGEISNIAYLPVTSPTPTLSVHSNSSFPLSATPTAVVTGDFNGDGSIDFAVTNQSSGSVLILLGNTNGTLYSGNSYPVGRGPAGIASGDFNGDGKLDLVVANGQDQTLTILLGNGDGTFTVSPSTPTTGAYPASIAVADFNGDGKLDLAVVNMCGSNPLMCSPAAAPQGPFVLTILLGNGDGTFTPTPTSPTVGNQPSYMTAGDFNSDGLIDLAVSNMGDGTVTILMGNGDGTFTPTTNPPTTGTEPQGLVAADFNGDGALDLAVVNQIDGTVSILLNQNCATVTPLNCTFATSKPPTRVGNSPLAIGTADLNGDGFLDLVITNSADNTISVLLGSGSGGFTAVVPQNPQNFATPPRPISLALADVNHDGRVDVVAFGGGYSVMLQSTVAAVGLTASNPPVIPFGQQIYLTATVSRPATFPFLPTGTVSFMDGATSLATVSVDSSGHAVYQTSTLSTGTHQITAVYSGDYYYGANTSAPLTQTVLQTQSYTVLTSSANPSGTGQGLAFVATLQLPSYLTATGTVAFQDLSTNTSLGTATVSNNSAQIVVSNLSNGTHSILATYSGDVNFASSTSRLSQTVSQATTTLSLGSNLSTSSYSQAVTVTATVQPSYAGGSATGTVSFYDNGTFWQTAPVLNNVAQISVTGFAVGSHSLTATYWGDTNFTGSSASAISLVVTQAATTVSLVSNANPSVYGQPVTYTATVGLSFNGSTPSGAITFYDGATVLWSGFLSRGSAQASISNATPGSHSITAQYGGTANYTASTSPVLTQTVNQAPTTLTVSSNANPSSYGQSVTLYATLQTSYNLLSNGGTVTFTDNGTQLGTATIQGSATVSITTTTLGVGVRTITAKYSGDSNLLASTGTFAQTVNPAATTTTISSTSYTPAFGQSITLTANVRPTLGNTPTGTITFMDRTTTLGTVPLANNTASFSISTLSAGTHYISAQYSGDADSAASTSGQTLVTVSPPATTTVLASSVNPSSYNQPVILTATLQLTSSGTPTGTVIFYDGSSQIGSSTIANNSAQLTISGFQLGTHSITATYSGDANFSGSTSTAVSQVVNAAPTTTTVTSLDNPGTVGFNVRFLVGTTAAFGGGPAGSVTLYDGATVVGVGNLPGTVNNNSVEIVVSGLAAGSHSMTAKYSGSVYYAAGTSSLVTQVMNLPATSTYLNPLTNPVAFGQALTLVASVQPPGSGSATGTIAFLDGATALGTATVANNAVRLSVSSLSVGSHTLTAKYSGDSNFAASTSTPVTETVNQAATTTTVSSSATPSAYNQSVTFSASVAPAYGVNATGTVTFLDGATSLGTASVSNNSAQITVSTLSVGTHSVTAKYSGDSNFTGSTSAVLSQTVNPATTTTTLVTNLNPSTYGQSVSFSATVQPPTGTTATGTVTFLDGSTSLGSATSSGNSAQLNIASLGAGTHSITAVYSGDSNMAASTSAAVTQQVNRASTTATASSSVNPSAFGQPVMLTATVQPPTGTSATGTVTFLDGSTSLGSATLSGNSTQLSIASLGTGTHSITAVYSGDTNMAGSTSAAVAQQVNQASTATTLSSGVNPSVFGQTITFTATVQPPAGTTATGTVTFLDGSTSLGSATLAGISAQLSIASLGTGSHSVTAVYSGDTNLAGSSSAAVAQQVSQASTATTLSSGVNPSVFGQTITFTATVQPPAGTTATGTVTFLDGSTSLGSATLAGNSAQLTVSSLTVGTHSITAMYAGNANLLPSTSVALSQTVNGEATTTVATSSTNPSSFGQSITLSATIQPALGGNATGTVTFLDGTSALGTGSVSSNTAQLSVSSLAVGAHSITAKYSGDANYLASTSSAFTQTVNQGAATTSVSSSLNPAVFGQSATFRVSVQATSGTPTGTVTLMDGSTSLGTTTLGGGIAQFTIGGLSLGSHSITATYGGDANFAGSASSVLTEVVNQAATTTSLSSSVNPSSYGQAVTFTASVLPSSGGSVSGSVKFWDGTVQIGSAVLSSGIATFTTSATALNGGSHSITASYSGDTNFTGSNSSLLSQTVNPVATITTLASNLNPSVAGQNVTFTATVSSSVSGPQSGTVNFYLDGSTTPVQSSSVSGNTATFSTSSLSAGNHTISAAFVSSSPNFAGSSSTTLTQSVEDFSISASPTSRTISHGHSGTYTLTLTPVNGFTGNISLSCSGAPTNTTCSVSPSQVTLNGTSSAQATVTVTVAKNATSGSRTLTLQGTSGSVTHSVTVSLTIN